MRLFPLFNILDVAQSPVTYSEKRKELHGELHVFLICIDTYRRKYINQTE
jgi:hypothetical protein